MEKVFFIASCSVLEPSVCGVVAVAPRLARGSCRMTAHLHNAGSRIMLRRKWRRVDMATIQQKSRWRHMEMSHDILTKLLCNDGRVEAVTMLSGVDGWVLNTHRTI